MLIRLYIERDRKNNRIIILYVTWLVPVQDITLLRQSKDAGPHHKFVHDTSGDTAALPPTTSSAADLAHLHSLHPSSAGQ